MVFLWGSEVPTKGSKTMARVTLRDKVTAVNSEIKTLVEALGRLVADNPGAFELVCLLSGKTGTLDALIGIDRLDEGLPYAAPVEPAPAVEPEPVPAPRRARARQASKATP